MSANSILLRICLGENDTFLEDHSIELSIGFSYARRIFIPAIVSALCRSQYAYTNIL